MDPICSIQPNELTGHSLHPLLFSLKFAILIFINTAYNFYSTPSFESGKCGLGWARSLTYITGTVEQGLLLRNEYLVAEKVILKTQFNVRLFLSKTERATPIAIDHRLFHKGLEKVAATARPDTILGC